MKKQYGVDSMPETAENVAEQYKVSREDQDLFAFRSQLKTARAQQEGVFAEEIVPVSIPPQKDPLVFDTDEHPRASTLEKLAALQPTRENGSVTAGNASGVNDGAATMLVANEAAVKQHGRAYGENSGHGDRWRRTEDHVHPVPAVQKLLKKQGISIDEIDVLSSTKPSPPRAWLCCGSWALPMTTPGEPERWCHCPRPPTGHVRRAPAADCGTPLQRTGGRYACAPCVCGQGIATLIERV